MPKLIQGTSEGIIAKKFPQQQQIKKKVVILYGMSNRGKMKVQKPLGQEIWAIILNVMRK